MLEFSVLNSVLRNSGKLLKSVLSAAVVLLPVSLAAAEGENSVQNLATRINGESLVYFILLLFIGYLFFRKPLP